MATITVADFASKLDGREYRSEISNDECRQAKRAGLCVVFGYSDDNVELRGVIKDEVPGYEGAKFTVDKAGPLVPWDRFIEDRPSQQEAAAWFSRAVGENVRIDAKWDHDGYSWFIDADASEKAYFDIVEDGEKFCRGVVFRFADPT